MTDSGEKEDSVEATRAAIFLKGMPSLWASEVTCKENVKLFFFLWSVDIGRSMSLGYVEISLNFHATVAQELNFVNRPWKKYASPPTIPAFGDESPSFLSFKGCLFHEALWPPQQVTPSPASCSEFTEWALSLSCFIYCCKNVNFLIVNLHLHISFQGNKGIQGSLRKGKQNKKLKSPFLLFHSPEAEGLWGKGSWKLALVRTS